MKWCNSDSYHDITRGPETDDERVEAADLWRILRHLTSCADIDQRTTERYGMLVEYRHGAFVASYWAAESTSMYRERGTGLDPVEALRNMHECLGAGCDDPKHNEYLDARMREDIDD